MKKDLSLLDKPIWDQVVGKVMAYLANDLQLVLTDGQPQWN